MAMRTIAVKKKLKVSEYGVFDEAGKSYLDMVAGLAVNVLGHCHPAVSAAIAAQAEILIHICGTDFHYPGYGAMCERLGAAVGAHGRAGDAARPGARARRARPRRGAARARG